MYTGRTVVCRNSRAGTTVEVPASKLELRPSVYGIVMHEEKILLSQFAGGWLLPGGGIDPGETLEAALRREIQEETGLSVSHDSLLHFEEDFVQTLNENRYFHALRWYYLCKDPQGTISTDGFTEFEKEHMQMPEWVPLQKALTLKLHHPIDPQKLIHSAIRAAAV